MNKEFWFDLQSLFIERWDKCYFCDVSPRFKELWSGSLEFVRECFELAKQFVRENNIEVENDTDNLFEIPPWHEGWGEWMNKMREIRLNFLDWVINKSE